MAIGEDMHAGSVAMEVLVGLCVEAVITGLRQAASHTTALAFLEKVKVHHHHRLATVTRRRTHSHYALSFTWRLSQDCDMMEYMWCFVFYRLPVAGCIPTGCICMGICMGIIMIGGANCPRQAESVLLARSCPAAHE